VPGQRLSWRRVSSSHSTRMLSASKTLYCRIDHSYLAPQFLESNNPRFNPDCRNMRRGETRQYHKHRMYQPIARTGVRLPCVRWTDRVRCVAERCRHGDLGRTGRSEGSFLPSGKTQPGSAAQPQQHGGTVTASETTRCMQTESAGRKEFSSKGDVERITLK
jgi:hypothetical protein